MRILVIQFIFRIEVLECVLHGNMITESTVCRSQV